MAKTIKANKLGGAVPQMGPSEDDYRAEDDHRTLTRAEDIRSDAGRMKGVLKHQSKMERALGRMARTLPRPMRRGR